MRIGRSFSKCGNCVLYDHCTNTCYFEAKKIESQYEQGDSIFEECFKLAKEWNMDSIIQVLQRPTKEVLENMRLILINKKEEYIKRVYRRFCELRDYLSRAGRTPSIDTVADHMSQTNSIISNIYYINILLEEDKRSDLEEYMQLGYYKDGVMYSYDTNSPHPFFN